MQFAILDWILWGKCYKGTNAIIGTNGQNWNRGYRLDKGVVLSKLNFPNLVTVL